jgi:hypothetical protein
VAGADEAVEGEIGRFEQGLERRHDGDVVAEDREVWGALGLGLEHGERRARHGGLEAEAEEDDLALRMAAGEGERIERRVDDAHIRPLGLGLHQALPRARDAHGVAEGGEEDLGPLGERHAVVDPAHGQDADRTAGAWTSSIALGSICSRP